VAESAVDLLTDDAEGTFRFEPEVVEEPLQQFLQLSPAACRSVMA